MLQHEPEEPTVPNASDARVTPGELNAALKALEDQQNSTVAIGSVVDELRLNATPEQIWEQVQQQRAQATTAQTPPVQTVAPQSFLTRYGRHLLVLVAVCGTLYDYIFVLHPAPTLPAVTTVLRPVTTTPPPVVMTSGQTITISGDGQLETIPVQGKDVIITGDGDNITLKGRARLVTVSGDGNIVEGDAPKASSITGDGNNIQWSEGQ